jgi:hypothetical protein
MKTCMPSVRGVLPSLAALSWFGPTRGRGRTRLPEGLRRRFFRNDPEQRSVMAAFSGVLAAVASVAIRQPANLAMSCRTFSGLDQCDR